MDPKIIPKINLSIPKNLFSSWPTIPKLKSGQIVIPYQKSKIKGFLNKNLIFLLSNHSIVQITNDIKMPPIQVPEIVSSIPNHLESPKPPAATTAQTGQTAFTKRGENSKNPKLKRTFLFCFFFEKIDNSLITDDTP